MSYVTENLGRLQRFTGLTRQFEDLSAHPGVVVGRNRRGELTARYDKRGSSVFLHHPEQPIQEATELVSRFALDANCKHVLFYGVGLGYHIDAFVRKYPDMPFSIYEPDIDILYSLFSHRSMEAWDKGRLRNLYIERTAADSIRHLKDLIDKSSGNVFVYTLPSYLTLFKDQCRVFSENLKQTIKRKRVNLQVSYGFQRSWTDNCIANFSEVLATPDMLKLPGHPFRRQPAILVAAGPSLDEELDTLKEIKRRGAAYIFSVGSAINTLLEHDIYPDAACTYDPGSFNINVFQKIIERGISTIPLIFGTSVDRQTVERYPGPKLHMTTSQDLLSRYFIQFDDGSSPRVVNDASSISIVMLQLLARLGCSPIILVGQNCAYKNKKHYASGIGYGAEEHESGGLMVEDVTGALVETTPSFNLLREELEMYVRMLRPLEVINTTKGGARIEGVPFVELNALLQERLRETVVKPDWHRQPVCRWNTLFMKRQADRMERSQSVTHELIMQLSALLFELELRARKEQTHRLRDLFDRFDASFKSLQQEDFFQVFVMPMNRVQYEMLYGQVESLRLEKDPSRKAARMFELFGELILQCRDDLLKLDQSVPAVLAKLKDHGGEEYVKEKKIKADGV